MEFRQFLESFDNNIIGWATLILAKGQLNFEPTRMVAFADWLQEHGYEEYAKLIRCTSGGLPKADVEGCDPHEMKSLAMQIDNYHFLQMRLDPRGMVLSAGKDSIIVSDWNGRAKFYDPDSPRYASDIPINQFSDSQRRLVAFGVLKKLVFVFWNKFLKSPPNPPRRRAVLWDH